MAFRWGGVDLNVDQCFINNGGSNSIDDSGDEDDKDYSNNCNNNYDDNDDANTMTMMIIIIIKTELFLVHQYLSLSIAIPSTLMHKL